MDWGLYHEDAIPFACSTCCRAIGYGLFFESQKYLAKRQLPVSISMCDLRRNSDSDRCALCHLILQAILIDLGSDCHKHDSKDNEYVETNLIPYAAYDPIKLEDRSSGLRNNSGKQETAQISGLRLVITTRYRTGPLDWCIQQVASSGTSPSTDNIFKVRKIDPKRADFALIRKWVSTCRDNHNSCQSRKSANRFSKITLRVIDIENYCLVSASLDCSYVALSYVWGNDQKFKLTSHNMATLYCKDSLQESNGLSATVIDAMEVCRLIGERYLWVDALCIMQDSMEDVTAQIFIMDRVYNDATLTIVAASGTANDGIHGIRQDRTAHYTRKVGEFELAVIPTQVSWHTSHTLWSTRGWTLQEQFLSRRSLIFTSRMVVFRCQQATFREDVSTEFDEGEIYQTHDPGFGPSGIVPGFSSVSSRFTPPEYVLENSLSTARILEDPRFVLCRYQTLVTVYCQRSLSNEDDIINAFDGIIKVFSPTLGSFRFAMPIHHLRYALLWKSEDSFPLERRTTLQLPSWSWATWKAFQHRVGWFRENTHSPGARILIKVFAYTIAENSTLEEVTQSGFLRPDVLRLPILISQLTPPPSPAIDADILHRLKFPRHHYLLFWTSAAYITVARTPISGTTNRFKAAIGEERCYATLYLSPVWREKQPDELEFVVIGESNWSLILMLIERTGDGTASRIQILTSVISTEDWIAANPVQNLIILV